MASRTAKRATRCDPILEKLVKLRNLVVPTVEDLEYLPVEVVEGEGLGVCTVTALGAKGTCVSLTWDVVARSVFLQWTVDGTNILLLTRESAVSVTIEVNSGDVLFRVHNRTNDLEGVLEIRSGAVVTLRDTMLFC